MAFDIFSQPQGPNIDVNLFANNATAGVKVGQALGTPLSNAIEGITKGYLTGQQIQQNAANIELTQANAAKAQAEVQNIPIENEIRQQQLKNQQVELEVNKLKLQVEQATIGDKLEADRLKLENDKAVLEQKKADRNISSGLGQVLTGPDEQAKIDLMSDPVVNDYLRRNPDEKKAVIGSLLNTERAKTDPDFRQSLQNELDSSKVFEYEQTRKKAQEALEAKQLEEFPKALDAFKKDAAISDIGGANPAVIRGYQVLDQNMYEISKEGTLTGKVLESDLSKPQQFAVFDENGKLVRGGLTSEQASKIKNVQITENAFNNALLKQSGLPPIPWDSKVRLPSVAKPQAAAPQGSSGGVMQYAGDIFRGLTGQIDDRAGQNTSSQPQAAAPSGTTSPSPQGARPASYQPQTAHVYQPTPGPAPSPIPSPTRAKVVQTLNAVTPPVLGQETAESVVQDTRPLRPEEVQKTVENYAQKAATDSVKVLSSGSKEEKAAVRSFAEKYNIPKTVAGFKDYYEKATAKALEGDFNPDREAGFLKVAEKRNAVRPQMFSQQTGGSTIGIGPGEISLPSAPIDIAQSVNNVADQFGLTPKQRASTLKVVGRVNSNQLLQDKPAYVKALASQESAGVERAVSPTGVRGYLQVTKRVANSYGLNRDIPEENILAGQYYIEDLTKQFGGNRMLAYAAYNAGPAAIHYAQKLAKSDEWKDVKKFLLPALRKYERAIGVPAEKKLTETYTYPEKVSLYEAIYNGGQSNSL